MKNCSSSWVRTGVNIVIGKVEDDVRRRTKLSEDKEEDLKVRVQ